MGNESKIALPNIEDFKLAWVAVLLYTFLLILGTRLNYGLVDSVPYSQIVIFSVIAGLIVESGLLLFYIKLFGMFGWREFLVRGRQWLVLGVGAWVLFYVFASIASHYGISHRNQNFVAYLPPFAGGIYVADLVLIGPILEELTMRRYLLELLRGKSSTLNAVWIVSLIDTLMHFEFYLPTFLFIFFFFCLNSVVYLYGGLGAAVLLHMVANTYIVSLT